MSRRNIATLTMALLLVVTAAVAQDAQEAADEREESMYVSLTYVTIKAGMEQPFMAAVRGHLDWHKSTNDTHYYSTSRVATGARTGQMVFSAGPMTGAQLDEYNAFGETDMADWANRGGMQYTEAVETLVLSVLPGLGTPPPADYTGTMVTAFELDVDFTRMEQFHEALGKLDEAEKAAGAEGYSVYVAVASGDSITKRWVVNWSEGWDDFGQADPETQAKVTEAAGGEEAFQELIETLTSSVVSTNVTTYMGLPALSFEPSR